MKRVRGIILTWILFFLSPLAKADEGMWLPFLLEKLNERQMKSLGMKISARKIYNINKGSLKDAVLSFGGFCTGEIISSKGLVLTNHHCGFDAIQNHSTLEHNFIRDGFWARNYSEELPNEKLYVTFIVRIEEVSQRILTGITPSMNEKERQSLIDKNITEAKKAVKKESYQDCFVRGFFEGNQYYLFVTETYKDIRLVGAPPAAIGNFGKDSDNWMWPRHTGDFSMFRIYAGKDNKPAEYSPNNVPYVPKRTLSVSLDGVNEGDFTMVFGFPGRTSEYLYSSAVEQIMKVNDPAKIAIREKALQVIGGFMRKDEQIRISYAAKYASIENAYKKWQGEVLGLGSAGAVEKKKKYETGFQKRVENNPQWKTKYGNLLQDLSGAYSELKPFGYGRDYYNEIISRIELFTVARLLDSLRRAYEKDGENGYRQKLPRVRDSLRIIFNEYNPEVDKKLFESLMIMYLQGQEEKNVSPYLIKLLNKTANGLMSRLAEIIYGDGMLYDQSFVLGILKKPAGEMVKTVSEAEALKLYTDLAKTYQERVLRGLNEIQPRINQLQRTYMQAQMEVFREKTFYPDANGTLRLTYGKVKGYQPRDGVTYGYYTYLDGVMEKYKPGDYEFDVPEKLKSLYRDRDYGQYGTGGKMPVCFLASNHTTGGNSGSPVLDASGNLIGLNFDRVWEGTMSDINYDPGICRNIMVDIRYVLFIIDKYAGAGRLIEEMKLVHPKGKGRKPAPGGPQPAPQLIP